MKNWMKVMGGLLLFCLVFCLIQTAQSKGPVGEYSDDGTVFMSPNSGKILDQVGTVWNLADDIYSRLIDNYDKINYNTQVTVSSAGAKTGFNSYVLWSGSATHTLDNIGNYVGWTLAVPTATVTNDRTRVRIFNFDTNTQTIWVNLATGTASGKLSYPSTNYYVQDILPGENYDIRISSWIHPVLMSSGTFSTEKAQVTQIQ